MQQAAPTDNKPIVRTVRIPENLPFPKPSSAEALEVPEGLFEAIEDANDLERGDLDDTSFLILILAWYRQRLSEGYARIPLMDDLVRSRAEYPLH